MRTTTSSGASANAAHFGDDNFDVLASLVRATIEQFSKQHVLTGADEASACGIVGAQTTVKAGDQRRRVRVLADGTWETFDIDRWD